MKIFTWTADRRVNRIIACKLYYLPISGMVHHFKENPLSLNFSNDLLPIYSCMTGANNNNISRRIFWFH